MEAKLKYCFGAMGCGKTRKLQEINDLKEQLQSTKENFHTISNQAS